MKVLYFPANHSSAGFYRCFQPAAEMERAGHECFVTAYDWKGPVAQHHLTREDFNDADVVVLQMRPEPVWLKLIPQLQALGKKVVCEIDDWYGGLPAHHPARAHIPEVGPVSIQTMHRTFGLADALTVSTSFLRRAYERLNPNIHVLPNYLDWGMWEHRPRKNWKRLRIGWMGNPLLRPDDIRVLQGIIGPFLRRHPEVDFVAAGPHCERVHEWLEVPEAQRVSFQQVEFPQLPSIVRFDVGLVPLELHNFNEAKSHLKGLEYAAYGIPAIASPSEPYRQWMEDGHAGLLARRPRDWLRHLEALTTDPSLRLRVGRSARRKAQRNTIQEHWRMWERLYLSMLGDEYDQLARDAIKRGALQKPTELSAFLRFVNRPRTVVEIGSATGGMFYALAQVAADNALLVSIDLPFGDFQGEDKTTFTSRDRYGREDTPVDIMRGYLKEGQHAEFLRMDSQHPATRATLERILDGRRADLVFIDGDHSYEGVSKDFALYQDLGRAIAFHDILEHPREPRSQVHRLWAELRGEHHVREFVTYGEERGWGTWGGIGLIEMDESRALAA